MSLSGKVAIVTGSGQGLGLAYARELSRQGAAVVINDVNAETAAQAAAQIEADGGRATAVVVPVPATRLWNGNPDPCREPGYPRRRRSGGHRSGPSHLNG
jgi:NAD(P)-dependent dehydrogenase (short-subunit alcohol dehydrogenase family)